jgi:hypothetical protein
MLSGNPVQVLMKSAVGWSPETQLKATADPRLGFQAYKDIALTVCVSSGLKNLELFCFLKNLTS